MIYNKTGKGANKLREAQPIKEREKIEQIKTELLKKNYRNYMLFLICINTGLKINDILNLKVKHVKNDSYIIVENSQYEKAKKIPINRELKKEINRYIKNMKENTYIFQSQKGNNQPISRVQAYRILKEAGKKVGIENIGIQTLRKTFGYWHYKQYKDIALLQSYFNHSSPSITLKYIGIKSDIIDNKDIEFFL